MTETGPTTAAQHSAPVGVSTPAPAALKDGLLVWLRNVLLASVTLYFSFKYLVFGVLEKKLTDYGTLMAITQVVIVWVIFFSLVRFVLNWVPKLLRFTLPRLLRIARKDMLFLFIFLFIAGPLLMSGVYFIRQINYLHRNAGPANPGSVRYEKLSAVPLPRLGLSDKAIETMYQGSVDGRIDWDAWLGWKNGMPPLIVWGVFALLFVGLCAGFVLIFARRWLEEEQLAFPLARMGELFVMGYREPGVIGSQRLPLLRTKAFWIGFVLAVFFQINPYFHLNILWPIKSFYIEETVPFLGQLDYQSRFFWFRPTFLAMFFLCPRQILGSILFFHVLECLFGIVGFQLGYHKFTASELPAAPPFPFKSDQMLGGAIAFTLILVYLSRRHIMSQLASLWRWLASIARRPRGPQPVKDSPLGVGLLILSAAGFVAWTLLIGFQLQTSMLFLGCMMLAMTINSRGRAESGMPAMLVFSAFRPFELVPIIGSKVLGVTAIAATAVHGWLFSNNLFNIAPSFMDSMKMGQIARTSYRWVASVVLAAVLIGGAMGWYMSLASAYDLGISKWAFGAGSGWYEHDWAEGLLKKPVGFNGVHGSFAALGSIVVTGLWFLRNLLPGFGLHPIGYLLSCSTEIHHYSFSVIIAYVIKSVAIRYGGMKTYLMLIPLMVGILCGHISGGAVVGILNGIFGTEVSVSMI